MSLDGIFAHVLASELNNQLKDTRVDKVFQPEKDEIILIMRGAGKNKRLLFCCEANSARVHLTNSAKENPMSAPMFCMLLRKHLGGARINSVSQTGVERAIEFEFETHNELGDKSIKYLIIEIMGRFSNIIFVDQNRIIIDAMKHVDLITSSQRQVLPRLIYEIPPVQNKINPLEITKEQLEFLIFNDDSNKKTDKFLLECFLGVSPIICRELCHRAGVTDLAMNNLNQTQKQRFYFQVLNHIDNVKSNNVAPCILYDHKTRKPLYFSYTSINQYGIKVQEQSVESFSELLDLYYSKKDEAERARQRSAQLLKVLVNHIERLAKKQDLLSAELISAKDREHLKIYGDLITANIYRINQGDSFAVVENYFDEDTKEINIPLDINLTPSKNAQKYYKEYRRKKTSQQHHIEQIEKTAVELDYLESVLDSLARAQNVRDLGEIKEELISQGYIISKDQPSKDKKKKKAGFNVLEFMSSTGNKMFCGKNNQQNDYLTFGLSKKIDVWLHVKNIHGAHVVVSSEDGTIDDATLFEAATIAATYSKGKDSSKVEVDYTQVKNVRRSPLKKPGMVFYTQQKTIVVSPDEDLCQKLNNNK